MDGCDCADRFGSSGFSIHIGADGIWVGIRFASLVRGLRMLDCVPPVLDVQRNELKEDNT